MFETATFDSTGKITTQSRKWMAATFLLNASVVTVLVLIPLMHPQVLPGYKLVSLLAPPLAPSAPPVTRAQPQPTTVVHLDNPFAPPTRIPTQISSKPDTQTFSSLDTRGLESDSSAVPGADTVFGTHATVREARPEATAGPLRVPSHLLEGQIIFKRSPSYPAIAQQAHIEGTVVLQATISKAGTIEGLRAVSGPAMLRQAALDAVSVWRYRPYVLNGQPVEVETTVNVVFSLAH